MAADDNWDYRLNHYQSLDSWGGQLRHGVSEEALEAIYESLMELSEKIRRDVANDGRASAISRLETLQGLVKVVKGSGNMYYREEPFATIMGK